MLLWGIIITDNNQITTIKTDPKQKLQYAYQKLTNIDKQYPKKTQPYLPKPLNTFDCSLIGVYFPRKDAQRI
jgi:hypothetical protein